MPASRLKRSGRSMVDNVPAGTSESRLPGRAWLTALAHETRVVIEVVTTFSSFQVP